MSAVLFDTAPFCYFSFSDDGTLQAVNSTLARLLGRKKEELTGSGIEKILTVPTKIFFQTHFYPLVKMHGSAEEIFITLLTSDGEHLPLLMNASKTEEGLTICAGIIVHNRKKFEDELVKAKHTAEKALHDNSLLKETRQKLQDNTRRLEEQMQTISRQNSELNEMNHAVTHNLKEPLRKILMYANRLQEAETNPDLEKLGRAAEQMRSVVSALQEFVWLNDKKNEFQPVDLQKVVNRAIAQLNAMHDGMPLDMRMESLPQAEGDFDQLVLLFVHLLGNAIKFKKGEKATVMVSGTLLKKNSFKALKDEYQYEDFLKIEVTDLGIGFDRKHRENIFELFNKQHYGEGQGIGLALCRKIVDNHRGAIEADSHLHMSTTITIWLPLRQTTKAVSLKPS